jgi:hypothetical protein
MSWYARSPCAWSKRAGDTVSPTDSEALWTVNAGEIVHESIGEFSLAKGRHPKLAAWPAHREPTSSIRSALRGGTSNQFPWICTGGKYSTLLHAPGTNLAAQIGLLRHAETQPRWTRRLKRSPRQRRQADSKVLDFLRRRKHVPVLS